MVDARTSGGTNWVVAGVVSLFAGGVAALTATVITVGSYALLTETDAPDTPSSGKVALYAKTDSRLYTKDDAGEEKALLVAGDASTDASTVDGLDSTQFVRSDVAATKTGLLTLASGLALPDDVAITLGTGSDSTLEYSSGNDRLEIDGVEVFVNESFTATGNVLALGSLDSGSSGGNSGKVVLNGSTSGVVTLQVAAAAGTYTTTLPTADTLGVVTHGITIDGGGSAITTGVKGFMEIPYNCTITGWTLVSCEDGVPVSGSIVVDVWKDTYANYPPTVADTITASAKPTITTATKNTSTTLTGWTTTVTAGDFIGFNVDSCTDITKALLVLKVRKN